MKRHILLTALLCGAMLLSGCGGTPAPDSSETPASGTGQPLSEMEQLLRQTQEWEEAGTCDDQEAYQNALLRVAELSLAEDRGAYRCVRPEELPQDKRDALADAARRCAYVYHVPQRDDPFSEENLPSSIALMAIYTPGSLATESIWNMQGDLPFLPESNYYRIREADLLPFLDDAMAPAAQAFRSYGEQLEEWNWHRTEDGYLYMDVFGLTATLPSSEPSLVSVEPLGGNRYLVVCDMLPVVAPNQYQLAFVAEDTALPGEPPQVTVLDCEDGSHQGMQMLPCEMVSALRERYTVTGDQEAVELLKRLEALSPIPYHTELAGQMSLAMEQALEDAKLVEEMASPSYTFESYVQALEPQPTMYQFDSIPQEDQWLPADPSQTYPYGEAWNMFPAAELEEAFQRRFGMDLAANGRAWMNDVDFVPVADYLGGPMVRYDGENYMVYLRGVGGPMPFSYETSLVRHYDGTYIARFSFVPDEVYDASGTLTLYLRDIGTEEAPFFQLLGYELPM